MLDVSSTIEGSSSSSPLTCCSQSSDNAEQEVMTLRVKCNSPSGDISTLDKSYQVVTHANASVNCLKESIRNAIGQSAKGRYLRIISAGQLLAPDVAPLRNFHMKDGDCVHAVLAAAGVRGGHQAAMSQGFREEDDIEEQDLLGFDRLRATGLTREEIGAIRLYFSRHVDRFIEERGEEDESENRFLMEDEWMETQGPNSEFRLNLNTNNPLMQGPLLDVYPNIRISTFVGTDRDFVWGFILGFFVGFIMLFWVWMPTVPHKQKLGILTGISFQLGLNLLRTMSTGPHKDDI